MTSELFFEALTKHYRANLPFVVYSRPINSIIKCWLQNNDQLYKTSTYTESGFVFTPFNLEEDSILIPEVHSDFMSIETDTLEVSASIDTGGNAIDKDFHIDIINKAIHTIETTELSKVVISRYQTETYSDEPITIFKRLFNTYKNAMVYCWFHPKIGLWLGATPELLFKIEGQQLTTISLAGTKPYKEDSDVEWTSKELEEQQIVTDYITEQIKPYTHYNSSSELETTKAGQLLHLKTRIKARLKPVGAHLSDIITALHPTPAVCGFPKQMAKSFILDNESYDRQFYTGFLGELNLKMITSRNTNRKNVENNAYGAIKMQSNFYVNLRCMQLKSDKAFIYVGGGITKASNPEKEWEETVAKTQTMLKIL